MVCALMGETAVTQPPSSADSHAALRHDHELWRHLVRFDQRRVLVGLAMAGSLIIMPPAAGYAMSAFDAHQGRAVANSVMADNDNQGTESNDNDAPDFNDNVVTQGNDNIDESFVPPAPSAPAPPAAQDATGPSADEINNNSNISPNNN